MVLHSRGCGRVARRRIQRNDMGIPGGAWLPGIPLYSRSVVVPAGVLPGRPGGAFPLPGVPVGRNAPGTLFLFPHTGVSSTHWSFLDAGRPVSRMIPPPSRVFWTLRCLSAGGLFQSLGVSGRRGILGISRELLALIRRLNRLKNYALFRTQTLRRIE